MAYWYDGAALAATGSPVIALFWCLIKFTTTTTTTMHSLEKLHLKIAIVIIIPTIITIITVIILIVIVYAVAIIIVIMLQHISKSLSHESIEITLKMIL